MGDDVSITPRHECDSHWFDKVPDGVLDGVGGAELKHDYPGGIVFDNGVFLEIGDPFEAKWHIPEGDDG